MYDKETYEWYKAHKICPYCGKEPSFPGRVGCYNCLCKKAENAHKHGKRTAEEKAADIAGNKRLREKRRQAGQCIRCGKPRYRTSKSYCLDCLLKDRKRQATIRKKKGMTPHFLRAERPQDGLCYVCGKPVRAGYRLCEEHYRRNVELLEKYRPVPEWR